jgi:hypothetical protein
LPPDLPPAGAEEDIAGRERERKREGGERRESEIEKGRKREAAPFIPKKMTINPVEKKS